MQKAHLAMMDTLMTLAARQTVSQVKMAAEAEQLGAGAPWENALLFWVNRVRRICFKDFLIKSFSAFLYIPVLKIEKKPVKWFLFDSNCF